MKLLIEKIHPYFLGASSAFIWYRLAPAFPQGDGILAASLTISAILTGFLATAKAILMALNSPVMERIRSTNYINDLASYLIEAIWVCFSLCLYSILGFFFDTGDKWYGVGWIFIGITSIFTFTRVTIIMLKILKYQPQKKT